MNCGTIIMDELISGDGNKVNDIEMITTWHENETLNDVIAFAEMFDFGEEMSQKVRELLKYENRSFGHCD